MASPLLVTGFGPFPGVKINPTAALARAVARRLAARGEPAAAVVLPTSYRHGLPLLRQALLGLEPRAVLMLGLAARSRWVRVERFGRDDASPLAPDATGATPDRAIARQASLPRLSPAALEAALAAFRRQGLRSRLSPSAGRYLCNAGYALALKEAAAGTPVLFVHIPWPRGARGLRPAASVARWRPGAAALERAFAELARVALLLPARLR